MRVNKQLKTYRLYTKADRYLLGFEYKGVCYLANIKRLKSKWLKVIRACSKNGGGKKIQIALTTYHKKELIKQGAIPIVLSDGYNQGDMLEHSIRSMYGIEHKHDNLPFYKGTDILINDIGYSIKWENAQLCTYKTVNRLAKQG
jgi:hypothetical protein